MPRVLPFPGLRFEPAVVGELDVAVCPPYDVISPAEQARLQAVSPFNAVHLELPVDQPGRPGSRYEQAAETLAGWRQAGALRPDPQPAYYLLQTCFALNGRERVRRDVIAAVGLEPWSSGAVLPHERTMAGPKADRLALLRATGANTSPVWLLYREQPAPLAGAWQAAEATPPTARLRFDDQELRLWRIDDPALVAAIQRAFAGGGPLYVADGHHRYETALAFRQEAAAIRSGADAALAVLSWAADPGLVVLPTHRLLRRLAPDATQEELELRWSATFHAEYFPVWQDAPAEQVRALVRQLESQGQAAPTFGTLGPDRDTFALLGLRGGVLPDGLLPADRSPAWKALDVSLLHVLLLDPLVAEAEGEREELLVYTRDPAEAFGAVRDGSAAMAFFVNPTPVEQVLAVADAGDRMPEKSTFFYPKPPTGLVIRDLAS